MRGKSADGPPQRNSVKTLVMARAAPDPWQWQGATTTANQRSGQKITSIGPAFLAMLHATVMTRLCTSAAESALPNQRLPHALEQHVMQVLGNRLRHNDTALARNEEPALGSHLVTPRWGFAHHGIYVGGGKVVHYGTYEGHLFRGPVQEVSLDSFSRGHAVWVRAHERARFGHTHAIRRARSRVGENCYRLLTNNCEHFCEWCLQGEHRSYQVDSLLALPRRLEVMIRALLAGCVALFQARELRRWYGSPTTLRWTR